MRTYCIVQGTLLRLYSDLNGKEIQKRGNICIHIIDSLCVGEKLKQHCRATMLQFKKKFFKEGKKKDPRNQCFHYKTCILLYYLYM